MVTLTELDLKNFDLGSPADAGEHTFANYILEDFKRQNLLLEIIQFVNATHDMPNAKKHQAMLQKFFPFQKQTVWRGTKFKMKNIKTMLDGKPFTIKAEKPFRSWTTVKTIAMQFSESTRLRHDTFGIILQDVATPEDVIIDFSNKEFVTELEYIQRKTTHHMLEQYLHKNIHLIRREREVIRFVKTREYTLCDDIISFTVVPSRFFDHRVFNSLLQHVPDESKKLIKKLQQGYGIHNQDVTFVCMDGKIMMEPLR